ncbi:hypothetical protein QQF64_022631 [Cirrhinus molitorella]|uniref:Uncharacterized protein n=1 Tax=Cirrhinus molitorella TaxID=172907 RepID=A0ABR3L4C3_9TELE
MTRLQTIAAPEVILLHRRMLYSSARALSARSTTTGQLTRHSSAPDHSEPCNQSAQREFDSVQRSGCEGTLSYWDL